MNDSTDLFFLSLQTFFYPQESLQAVEFHKSNGMGNRLTKTSLIFRRWCGSSVLRVSGSRVRQSLQVDGILAVDMLFL